MKIINFRKTKTSDGYNYLKQSEGVYRGKIEITQAEFNMMTKTAMIDERIEKSNYLGSGDYAYMTRQMLADYIKKIISKEDNIFTCGVYWTKYFTDMFNLSNKLKKVNYYFEIV